MSAGADVFQVQVDDQFLGLFDESSLENINC